MTDLKPCPFCGRGVAMYYSLSKNSFVFYHSGGNKKCAFRSFRILVTEAKNLKEAAELWNRRADDGRPD